MQTAKQKKQEKNTFFVIILQTNTIFSNYA